MKVSEIQAGSFARRQDEAETKKAEKTVLLL